MTMREQLKFEIDLHNNELEETEEHINELRDRLAKESGIGEIQQILHDIEWEESQRKSIQDVLRSLMRIERARLKEEV